MFLLSPSSLLWSLDRASRPGNALTAGDGDAFGVKKAFLAFPICWADETAVFVNQ